MKYTDDLPGCEIDAEPPVSCHLDDALEAAARDSRAVASGTSAAPAWLEAQRQANKSRAAAEALRDNAPKPATREAVMICGADVTEHPICWLQPHRIPRQMPSVLASRPGLGKTLVACATAAVVTTGGTFFDGAPCDDPGSVIFLDAENPADTVLVPRLRAAGCDLRKVHIITGQLATDADGHQREVGITLQDIGAIERAIQHVGDARLLVVDPIGSFLGGQVDAHRDNETRAVLAPLAALAERRNIAVLMIAHHRKQSSGFADDLVLGSRAFTGLCRISWHICADANDKSLMLLTLGKTNIGPRVPGWSFRIGGDPPVVRWMGPVEKDADDVIGDGPAKRGPKPERREACVTWLRNRLAAGPALQADVMAAAESADYTDATLRRAKKALGVEAARPENPGPWWWRLPPAPGGGGAAAHTTQKGKPAHLAHVLDSIGVFADAHPPDAQVNLSCAPALEREARL